MVVIKAILAKILTAISSILSSITTIRANGIMITSTSTSAKTGTSTYDGGYYVDKSVSTPSGYTFLCAKVTSTTDNRYAHVQLVWAGTYRIWTRQANTTVSFDVIFYKTIG